MALAARLREIGVVPGRRAGLADRGCRAPRRGAPRRRALLRRDHAAQPLAAVEALAAIRAAYPGRSSSGAGTVLSIQQVDARSRPGADSAVAPGTNPPVVEASLARGLPIFPGASQRLARSRLPRALGMRTAQALPSPSCSAAPRTLSALFAGPIVTWTLRPDRFDHAGDAARLPRAPQALACGGSWMVKPAMIAAGELTRIASNSPAAIIAGLTIQLPPQASTCGTAR